ALQQFREALRLDASYAEAHYNLASALRSLGETAEAIEEFRRAVTLSPDLLPAVVDLAWLLSTAADTRLHDGQEAVRLAERAADLSGRKNPAVLDVAAAAYAASGQFDRAVAYADAALMLSPSVPLAEGVRRRRQLYLLHQVFVEPPAPAR